MMGSSTRSGLSALTKIMEQLSDQPKVKETIAELQKATAAHDEAKKSAIAAIAEAEKKASDVAKREAAANAKDAELTTNAESLLQAKNNFLSEKKAFEAKQSAETSSLAQAKDEHESALKIHQATVAKDNEELVLRKAEIDQAQRALNERAARVAQAESELRVGQSDLAKRLAKMKQLAS